MRAVEPDLLVPFWFQWYGIAAKRVRSRAKILERVRAAAGQIQKHQERGFVGLSLDNYSDRQRRVASGVAAGEKFFGSFPELVEAEAWLAANAPWVKGIFVFGFLAAWGKRNEVPTLNMSSLHRVTLLNLDQRDQDQLYSQLDELAATFVSRWPARGAPGSAV